MGWPWKSRSIIKFRWLILGFTALDKQGHEKNVYDLEFQGPTFETRNLFKHAASWNFVFAHAYVLKMNLYTVEFATIKYFRSFLRISCCDCWIIYQPVQSKRVRNKTSVRIRLHHVLFQLINFNYKLCLIVCTFWLVVNWCNKPIFDLIRYSRPRKC